MATRRGYSLVIISEEYLDGCVGISVEKPAPHHEHVNRVPRELLDRLARATKALRLIEDELREHMTSGSRAVNPDYVPDPID